MIARPRYSAAASLDALIYRAAHLSRPAAWSWSLGLLLLIALADWASGTAVSMNGLYMLPLCLSAWSLGTLRGLAVGFAFAMTTVWLNGFGDGFSVAATHVPSHIAAWNVAMRCFWIVTIVLLVAGFRRSFNTQFQRARTDDLTGALTKQAPYDHTARTIVASAKRGFSITLVYADLDGFKQVNDRHGHAAGDATLVAFADAASGAIRSRDVLARVGGDEFVMLLTTSSSDEGFAAAERLHREIGAALRALPYPVTASMGAAVVERPQAGDQAAFLTMADTLMYEVKRAGKNALRVAYVDRPAQMAAVLAEAA